MNATKALLSGLPFFKRCVVKVLTKLFFIKIVINLNPRDLASPKAGRIKNFKEYIKSLKQDGVSKHDAIDLIENRLGKDRIEFSDIPRLVYDIYDEST